MRTGRSIQTMTTSDLEHGNRGDDRGQRFGSAAAAMVGGTFDQLPYPAFIYDNVSTIVAVNRAGQRLLRSSSGNVAGRPCSEVFHCRTCDHECGVLAGLSQQQVAAEHSVRIATIAGREYLAFVKLSNLTDDAGAIQGVLAMFTSVIDAPLNQRQSIVGESRVMREVLCFARRVAASEASSILVEGESGTGKELVAKLLHDESRRSAHPFIAINCAAMPETLLESELFGYERGAFTDARVQKQGLFELANKGTLFLDEIGELPLKVQAKLLRVLDDRTSRRLGGVQNIECDLRIVAATNRDLRLAVREGAFRLDLFYRINVIQLTIPPLRDRRDDILPLARFFIERFARKFRKDTQSLPDVTARLLIAYDWPGNVRELRNLIERAVLLAQTDSISPDSLPVSLRGTPTEEPECLPEDNMCLADKERLLIETAMERANSNQTKAAKLLGVTRDVLRYKLKNHNGRGPPHETDVNSPESEAQQRMLRDLSMCSWPLLCCNPAVRPTVTSP